MPGDPSLWHIGLARRDITAWEPEQLIFGWGDDDGRARGVRERLFARALVIQDGRGGAIATACLDLCFISSLLREAILDRLASRWPEVDLPRQAVMLTATHTHSGPAGLSDSPLYEMMNFGFSPGVFEHVVAQTAAALAAAWQTTFPGRVRLGRAEASPDAPIAINRSMKAHNGNAEACAERDPGMAVERCMTVLRIEDAAGRERGMISWFASHGTVIHGGQTDLHPDHKGLSAHLLERHRATTCPDYVAIFAQGAAGNVSPNFRWSEARQRMVGITDDDNENLQWVVEQQIALAENALSDARAAPPLTGKVRGRIRNADIANTTISTRFCRGLGAARSRPACLGSGFLTGTNEGPGPLFGADRLVRLAGRILCRRSRRRRSQLPPAERWRLDPMVPFGAIGSGVNGVFWGLPLKRVLPLLAPLEASLAWVCGAHLGAGTLDRPWLSGRMPAQLLHIGSLTVAGVPCEPTVMAGRRIASAIQTAQGVDTGPVVVAGYANAYAGYITTFEEYQYQTYEGGSTLFGPWTLAAWLTTFDDLARQKGDTTLIPGPRPILPDLETLIEEREQGRARMGRFAHRVDAQRFGQILGRV